MGILWNKNAPVVELHSAYGVTLKGEIMGYESPYSDGLYDKVITEIYVNDHKVYLGNGGAIALTGGSTIINMESDKDLLCWWLSRHPKNDEELERFFEKEYKGTLWRSRAVDEWMRESREEEERQKRSERERERHRKIENLQKYADKKGLHMVVEYDTAYFIKLSGKNKDAAGKVSQDRILQFAREHPGNGCDIVEEREIA